MTKPPVEKPRKPLVARAHLPPPWQTPEIEDVDIRAFRALAAGVASDVQQKRALDWIVKASGYYELSFRTGDDGDRATAFAEGKRFVGALIIGMEKAVPADTSRKP